MNYLIHQLLNAEEINLLKNELGNCSQQDWEDGKKTAGSHASIVKNNLQLNRNTEISKKNAYKILDQFDIIIDGSDNFKTKFLLRRICK